MIRTFLIFTVFWIVMLLSLVFYIPMVFLSLPFLHKIKERYVLSISRMWARFVLFLIGARVETEGLDHIPENYNICFVGNHQSYADIPLVMANLPRKVGFLAKRELKYFPFISSWMKTIGCLFLDRGNPRQAFDVFSKAAEDIKRGNAKLIFPEGTRSKGGKMGTFHMGALKLAFQSDATVVPFTIDGTYHLLEETGRFTPSRVRFVVHPPISVAGLSREEQKRAASDIREAVASGFSSHQKQF